MSNLNQRITALIPSRTLRAALEKMGINFGPADLTSLAWHYARSWEERMALLEALGSPLTEGLTAARQEYLSPVPGAVFDLVCGQERTLFASHEGALTAAGQYPMCKIVKRKPIDAPGQEDDLGCCEVVGGQEWMFWGENALSSPEHCAFPPFLPDCAPVCWQNEWGKVCYGVSIHLTDWDGQYCYLFDLDHPVMRAHDWENLTQAHEHVPFPLVEAVELTGRRREDWQAFAAYWEEK